MIAIFFIMYIVFAGFMGLSGFTLFFVLMGVGFLLAKALSHKSPPEELQKE